MQQRPPRKDDTERLRQAAFAVAREKLVAAVIEDGEAHLLSDPLHLQGLIDLLHALLAFVEVMDREALLQLTESARDPGIDRPRKQQSISSEQARLYLSIRRRMRGGASERQACRDECVARGASEPKEHDAFWSEYRRAKKRMEPILEPLSIAI